MKGILAALVIMISLNVTSQSCVGTWITIDDKTKNKKSQVKLYKLKGKLYGKIIHIYPRKGVSAKSKCTKCKGDLKNKPLMGLGIVRSLSWDGSVWKGGTITDPKNGKVYTCKLWIDPNNNNRLKVRGYSYGLYRTQTWKKIGT